MMKVKLIESKDNSIKFLLEGAEVAFANALRRIIIEEVPCMAIDDVAIIKNNSPLFDEILANRLGLIPLKTNLENYVLPEKCDCKGAGCARCSVILTLSKEGPGAVYSSDLKLQDPEVAPVSESVPILKLAEGQKVELEATARLGKGKNHAKWQPVSTSIYKYKAEIEIDEEACDACGKCIEECPKKILKIEKKKAEVVNIYDCILCKACEEICENKAIKVTPDDTAFVFNIETTGTLPPEKVVTIAAEILEQKADEFIKKIEEL